MQKTAPQVHSSDGKHAKRGETAAAEIQSAILRVKGDFTSIKKAPLGATKSIKVND